MTRQDFIKLAGGGLIGTVGRIGMCAEGPVLACGRTAGTVPPRNPHPYASVDWAHVVRVNTTSHGHCESQGRLKCQARLVVNHNL